MNSYLRRKKKKAMCMKRDSSLKFLHFTKLVTHLVPSKIAQNISSNLLNYKHENIHIPVFPFATSDTHKPLDLCIEQIRSHTLRCT